MKMKCLPRTGEVCAWDKNCVFSDKLKGQGGRKSRQMVDRYAKYSTEHLALAASRIGNGRGGNVIELSRFCHGKTKAT